MPTSTMTDGSGRWYAAFLGDILAVDGLAPCVSTGWRRWDYTTFWAMIHTFSQSTKWQHPSVCTLLSRSDRLTPNTLRPAHKRL